MTYIYSSFGHEALMEKEISARSGEKYIPKKIHPTWRKQPKHLISCRKKVNYNASL